jgi:hypothetical protein
LADVVDIDPDPTVSEALKAFIPSASTDAEPLKRTCPLAIRIRSTEMAVLPTSTIRSGPVREKTAVSGLPGTPALHDAGLLQDALVGLTHDVSAPSAREGANATVTRQGEQCVMVLFLIEA